MARPSRRRLPLILVRCAQHVGCARASPPDPMRCSDRRPASDAVHARSALALPGRPDGDARNRAPVIFPTAPSQLYEVTPHPFHLTHLACMENAIAPADADPWPFERSTHHADLTDLERFFRHLPSRTARTEVSNGSRTPGDPVERVGAPMSFARNAAIYEENDAADCIYEVVSGAVRTCRSSASMGAVRSAPSICPARSLVLQAEPSMPSRRKQSPTRRSWSSVATSRSRSSRRTTRSFPSCGHSWPASSTCTGSRLSADQDRARAGGQLSARACPTHPFERRGGAADVAPGHRGLSRSHDRNRLAHADATRGRSAIALPTSRRIVLRDRAVLKQLIA